MRILGIDYGKRKIGLAVAEGPLPRPLKVIRGKNFQDLIDKTINEIDLLEIEKIVVGLSEGKISLDQKRYATEIAKVTGLPVELEDETLTTKDAQNLSIQAGIKRSRRRKMEDAFSASLILQSYLEK